MQKEIRIYTEGNEDNIDKAIHGLDEFTKNWCMNVKETEEKNDLVFRCKECEFEASNGYCLVKNFAFNHESDYDLGKFGSMGSL